MKLYLFAILPLKSRPRVCCIFGALNTACVTAFIAVAFGFMPVQTNAASVLLWNKLGSESEIANSEVGPGIQLTSYIYDDWQEAQIVPAMFGNGLFINHDTSEGWLGDGANFFAVNINEAGLVPDRGTIEFWFQFKYDSSVHNHAYFFMTRDALAGHFPSVYSTTKTFITAGWNGWDYGSYGKRFFFGISGGGTSSYAYTESFSAAPGGSLEFNNDTLFHFAFVWDNNGIDGTADTVRLYVNGNQEGSDTGRWTSTEGFDPYMYLGSSPNYREWDHYYNAVKGVTDNFIVWDYAKTDFSNRFDENPGVSCEGILADLSALITGKSGGQDARVWTISLANENYCPAENAQLTGLTLIQTYGPACSPVITSPASFPLVVGDILANGTANGTVTLDFSGCANIARFSATMSFIADNGAVSGTKTLNNQFR